MLRGMRTGRDREGRLVRIPLLSISIAVVTDQYKRISDKAQTDQIETELKKYAKSLKGSDYVKDRQEKFTDRD